MMPDSLTAHRPTVLLAQGQSIPDCTTAHCCNYFNWTWAPRSTQPKCGYYDLFQEVKAATSIIKCRVFCKNIPISTMTHNARGKVLYFVMVSVDLFGCSIRMRLCEPFHKHKGGKFMFLNLDVKENVLEYCRSRERRRNSHNLQDHRRHCLINKYVFYKHNHILKAEIV